MAKNNRKYLMMGISLLLFAGLLCGCGGGGGDATEVNGEEPTGIPVNAVAATQGKIVESTVVKGKVEAKDSINIVPKASGRVSEVLVSVGDNVKKGQVLVRLESSEIQAQLRQAQAGLNTARTAYNNAKTNLQRTEELYNEGAVSLQQLEQARLNVESNNPQSAVANVELLQLQYDNTIIKSPIDGQVASCGAVVGEMAGSGVIATVVNMDAVVVKTDVTERRINDVAKGQEVLVDISSAGVEPFTGVVTAIAPSAKLQTKTYPLEITIINKDHVIKPGMFAEAKVSTKQKEDAIIIPVEAIVDTNGVSSVFVVKDNIAHYVEVETGLNNGDYVEILSGVAAGDTVVTLGQHKLQDNDPVFVAGGE